MALVDQGASLFWEVIRPAKGMVWDRHGSPGERPDPGTIVTAFCGVEICVLTPNQRAVRVVDRTCLSCADGAWRLRTGQSWPPLDY
ncbi:hypothetical protein [Actinoalloteichus hymeniacidonis]|uniref:Uncharacterized protein n=1 Tax=Actinoalloteichus hymeniacidonis TaxID=340345 RepID=A0AAC9HKS2_9PSEU|nr:hypothetical protein [Actinoalloteichus hymeniacidonis]AOS61118.1 hypothetical protein TL08_01385 [Actinoalloteichus hymeniacidonis]MBB5910881.1 hypothetical protein [Actinoalloteichus hymeniacidonis]